jgi:hypothetical protein
MSADDNDQTSSEKTDDEQKTSSETPEVSEEGQEKVRKMAEAYEDRETAVLPGTDRTITGTAVNEWLDDEGNPKFGKEKQREKDEQQEGDEAHEGDKQQEDQKNKENA